MKNIDQHKWVSLNATTKECSVCFCMARAIYKVYPPLRYLQIIGVAFTSNGRTLPLVPKCREKK